MNKEQLVNRLSYLHNKPTIRLIIIGIHTSTGSISVIKHVNDIKILSEFIDECLEELHHLVQLSKKTFEPDKYFIQYKRWGDKWNEKPKENS